MSQPLIVAIDKGTSVSKCLLFSAAGEELATAHALSSSTYARPGWHEENLEFAWSTLSQLVQKAMADAGARAEDVVAIGVTAHMGGLVLLDAANRPVRDSILWDDARASGVLEQWDNDGVLEKMVDLGGQAVLPGLAIPLLRWLSEVEPEALERAASLCATKDYLVVRLTGVLGTDESDAGWMPGDVYSRTHSAELHRACGIQAQSRLFPTIRRSESVVGGLCVEAAAALGLLVGTPVIAGLGDANASTFGVGAVGHGEAASVIGTSLLNNLVVNSPIREPVGIGFLLPHLGRNWLRMLPNTGGGSVNLRWLAETMYAGASDVYSAMDSDVAQEPIGARGVHFHPYLNEAGVVAPFYNIGARGQFTGLSVNSGRATLARAVYEGIALSVVDCYKATPIEIKDVRLTGGAARSEILCQTVADALGRPVLIMGGEEAAARGAAMTAAVGVGVFDDFSAAARGFVSLKRVFEPREEAHQLLLRKYEHFRRIRQAMQKVWMDLLIERRRMDSSG